MMTGCTSALPILLLIWMLQCNSCSADAHGIASSIISAICDSNDTDVLEFYRSVKSSYASRQAIQYPLLGKDLLWSGAHFYLQTPEPVF